MKKIFRKIKENKSFIAPLLILLVSLIIFGSGITYAYFQYAVEKAEISSLKVTGTDFDILIAGTPINASGVVSIYDEYKDSQSQKYNFTIRNESEKINACYDVILNVTSISTGLKNSNFKWELTNNKTGEVSSGNFAKSGNNDEITMEKSQNLARNETISYTLKIWLAYSSTEDQSSTQGANFAAKIKANVESEYCGELAVSYFEEFEASQAFVAPSDGTYKVELWGAQGGSATGKPGGYGAYTSGEITLSKGDKFYIHVGSVGKTVTSGTTYYAAGGYNGGGYGGNNPGTYSMGGGGATDIRLVGGYWDDEASLDSRIMVAAGGGGSVANSSLVVVGNAGGLTGYKGTASSGTYSTSSYYANGGDQSAGGVSASNSSRNGLYGKALQSSLSGWGGGGGGGLYGGARGFGTGGGGGSSYISGHTGCTTHSTGETFTNTRMIDGSGKIWTTTSPGATTLMPKPDHQGNYASGTGNTGSGHARITLIKKYNVSIVAYAGSVSGGTIISNLVTNGSFESNSNNWTSLTSGAITQEVVGGVWESGFAKIPNSVNLYKMYSNTFNIPSGNVVYARVNYMKKDSGNVNIMISDRTSGNLAHLDSKVSTNQSYDWKQISLLSKNTSNSLTSYNFELSSLTNSYTGWDNAMVFNVSASYGMDNIPKLSWIDENVPFVNGTGSVKTVKVLNNNSASFNVTPYTAGNYTNNYECYGKYDNVNSVNNIVSINGIESDVICYLYYGDLPNYTIAYNLNDGIANNITSYNFNSTFKLNNPTKEGFEFLGWTGSNGDIPQLTVIIPPASHGNRTYTANWSLKTYTITYDLKGAAQVNNPTTYDINSGTFTLINPSAPNCTFLGWTGSNGTTPSTSVTITVGDAGNKSYSTNWSCSKTFEYTNGEQTFPVPLNGKYRLEVWGASSCVSALGRYYTDPGTSWVIGYSFTVYGGKGGYATGEMVINKLETPNLFINIGGEPVGTENDQNSTGGYNGGGTAHAAANSMYGNCLACGGGGATHIATASGVLSALSSNQSAVLIAAGGGGGYVTLYSSNSGGGSGGGIGTASTCSGGSGTFGQGGSYTGSYGAGGGGGWFGGCGTQGVVGATGGSGYIGNANLINKSMYCNNCTASSASATLTTNTACSSATPTVNCAKEGHGYARITYLPN